ncbi:MAG: 30S ribosomal protein S3, partial [Chloroflexi bacterium]|nr:30S ribosomal protein S3 [Chloroflexota bacterium]
MGHKVHPVGFRLGVVRDWVAKWYTDKDKQFADNLYEDMMVRRTVEQKA